jgi:nucleotide-binding universal stress UspA family protein
MRMTARGWSLLAATDGSREARRALVTMIRFPWPAGTRVHGVVARERPVASNWPPAVWSILEEAPAREARRASRQLGHRWPDAEVRVVSQPPVDAILSEARRVRADVIVLGSRGHGAVSRLVLGSVSRGVVRRAPCSVLVGKGGRSGAARFLVGLDASPHARRALDLVARLAAPRGGEVSLVAVVEPVRSPALGILPPRVRATIAGELAALRASRGREAERWLLGGARRLAASGWEVRTEVREGTPVDELLAAARSGPADVIVVGARGVGGVTRLLLGSVAEGLLSRAPGPVLIVR